MPLLPTVSRLFRATLRVQTGQAAYLRTKPAKENLSVGVSSEPGRSSGPDPLCAENIVVMSAAGGHLSPDLSVRLDFFSNGVKLAGFYPPYMLFIVNINYNSPGQTVEQVEFLFICSDFYLKCVSISPLFRPNASRTHL